MARFLTNIKQVRSVTWKQGHRWDVRFLDAPSPFNQWFPATDYTDDNASSTSLDKQFFITSFKFPLGTSAKNLVFTTLDDHNDTLLKWVTEWIKSISDSDSGLMTLEESVKRVEIIRYDVSGNEISNSSYLVFPDMQIPKIGNSTGDVVPLELTFVIAG